MERQIDVKSVVRGRICVVLPDSNFRRVWERKGTVKKVPFEILREGMYDQGVEYMFSQGMLEIMDKQARIDLGLEDEETETSIVKVLTDTQRKRLLTTAPLPELKNTLEELSREQIEELVDYAIDEELVDLKRVDILKKYTQKDIMKAVMLKRDNEEK